MSDEDFIELGRTEQSQRKGYPVGQAFPSPSVPTPPKEFEGIVPARPLTIQEKREEMEAFEKSIMAKVEAKMNEPPQMQQIKIPKMLGGRVVLKPGQSIGANLAFSQSSYSLPSSLSLPSSTPSTPSTPTTPSSTPSTPSSQEGSSQPSSGGSQLLGGGSLGTTTPYQTQDASQFSRSQLGVELQDLSSIKSTKLSQGSSLSSGKITVKSVDTGVSPGKARIWYVDPLTKKRIKLVNPVVVPYGGKRKVSPKLPAIQVKKMELKVKEIPKPETKSLNVKVSEPTPPSLPTHQDLTVRNVSKPTLPSAPSIPSLSDSKKVKSLGTLSQPSLPQVPQISSSKLTVSKISFKKPKYTVNCDNQDWERESLYGIIERYCKLCMNLPFGATAKVIGYLGKWVDYYMESYLPTKIKGMFDSMRDKVKSEVNTQSSKMDTKVSNSYSNSFSAMGSMRNGLNSNVNITNNTFFTLVNQDQGIASSMKAQGEKLLTITDEVDKENKRMMGQINTDMRSTKSKVNGVVKSMNEKVYTDMGRMVSGIGETMNRQNQEMETLTSNINKVNDDQTKALENEINRNQVEMSGAINTQANNTIKEVKKMLGVTGDEVPAMPTITKVTDEYFEVEVPEGGMTLDYMVMGYLDKMVPKDLVPYLV